MPNQNAGAFLIWAIAREVVLVVRLDSSITLALRSSTPRGMSAGKSIVVHQRNPSWLPVFCQTHSVLLLPELTRQAICTEYTETSSEDSILQTNLSPLLNWVESQYTSSITGGVLTHKVRSKILLSIFLSGFIGEVACHLITRLFQLSRDVFNCNFII